MTNGGWSVLRGLGRDSLHQCTRDSGAKPAERIVTHSSFVQQQVSFAGIKERLPQNDGSLDRVLATTVDRGKYCSI